jgi:ABC-type methionine transport system permease subunit
MTEAETTPVVETKPVVVLLDKTVKVTKELNDVAVALVALTKSVKEANKDGFQAMTDIPAVLIENLKTLGAAIDNVVHVKVEVKENLPAAINTMTLAGTEILEELTK